MIITFEQELVQRIVRNFLDIHILRLIQIEPMWGYMISKRMETLFGIEIGHGALYPLLNSLEARGFLASHKQTKRGRVRKVYKVTLRGRQLVESYYDILREQLEMQDIKD